MSSARSPSERSANARVALITGASRGFGRLIAAGLAASGWRVYATMRDPRSREGLDEALAAAGAEPSRVTILPLDVLHRESIEAAVSKLLTQTGGRLDAVVPNAGILVAGVFEDTPERATRTVMDTNYFGVIETVRATLAALRASRGRIVIISSDSGLCGTPAMSAYTASKFAIEGWGESMSYELAPLGVAVSLIEPGPFKTEIFSSAELHRSSPEGPYAALGELIAAGLQAGATSAPDADPVVRAVLKALSAKKPRLRYPVGTEARLIFACRGVLPEPAFGLIVRKLTRMSWSPGG